MNTWIVFLLISLALLQFGLPQALINYGPLNQGEYKWVSNGRGGGVAFDG